MADYDIIPVYQALIRQGIPLWAFRVKGTYWRDMGTLQSYRALHEDLLTGKALPFFDPGRGVALFLRAGAFIRRPESRKGCGWKGGVPWEKTADSVKTVACGIPSSGIGSTLRKGVRIDGAIISEGRVVISDLLGDVV